jgi:hypothetical protein
MTSIGRRESAVSNENWILLFEDFFGGDKKKTKYGTRRGGDVCGSAEW